MNLDQSLSQLMEIDGAHAVAVVDVASGMVLGSRSNATFDMDQYAMATSNAIRDQAIALQQTGQDEPVEDFLITLPSQYQLINALHTARNEGLCVILCVTRPKGNLAMARRQLALVAETVEI